MNHKRIVSLLLALMMAIGMLVSTQAAAADTDAMISETGEGEQTGEEQTDPYPMINVPQIRVTTEEGNGIELQKEDGYVNASIIITDTDGSVLQDSVSFKVRGNTTAMLTVKKKAYTFKFGKKKNVLGLGSGKKWALLANAFDPTMLRNAVANGIAHEFGLQYTSNRRFVELWVDDSYRGCYELIEPVQEGKDRVNIDIESNKGMKDFLIEYEANRVEEDVTYFTVEGLRFISSEPEEPNEEQLAYITGTMQDIVDTLKNGSREEIEEKLDVESFAKFYLLNEYVKTFDFDMSSVFFYYQDGKLHAGPAWDYDLSAGNVNDALNSKRNKDAVPTTGLFIDQKNLYKFICDKEWFYDVVKQVYRDHYDYLSTIYTDGGLLDSLYAENEELFARNFSPDVWNIKKWWINIMKKPLATYQENYDYLKNWYRERDAWLTEYFELIDNEFLLGDVDGDGTVTIFDAAVIQRKLAELKVDSFVEEAGDADEDGAITVFDATEIQRWLAELPANENIGKPIA